jgi:hypothetical protein
VREWLLRDPLASWRRIICGLHYCGASTKEHSLGDSLIHYADHEELTGECVSLLMVGGLNTCIWDWKHGHVNHTCIFVT